MSKKIIFNYHPFTFQQVIYYYDEENDYREEHFVVQSQIPEIIKGLINSYNAKEVELYGPKEIMEHFKADILTNFEDNEDLKIEIKGE